MFSMARRFGKDRGQDKRASSFAFIERNVDQNKSKFEVTTRNGADARKNKEMKQKGKK
jgi:hypothetical protein